MNTRVVTNLDEFAKLEADWHRLAGLRENPLFSFDWHSSCAKNLGGGQTLHIVVHANDEGVVVAIAPLVRVRRDGIETFEYLGAPVLYEPIGLLYSDESSLAALYTIFCRLRSPVVLDRVWARNGEHIPKSGFAGFRGIWVNRDSAGSSVQNIPTSWESYLQSLSPSRRQNFRRKSRQLARQGKLSLVVKIPSEEETRELLDTFYEIEDSGWKSDRGSSILKNPDLRSFLEEYARRSARKAELCIAFLSIDDKPIAGEIHIHQFQCLWELKIGYRREYQRYSPGQILKHELTRYCIEKGVQQVEHLGSYDSWQEPWSQTIRDYRTLAFFPFSLRGLRALIIAVSSLLVRRLSTTLSRVR